MTSKQRKKIARRNGAQAAGTKSPAGIQQSAKNALKHGLTGKSLVLSNESQAKFDELRHEYMHEFDPQTCVERDLVDDMVASRWRLKRIRVLQTAAIDLQMDRMDAEIEKSYTTIDQPTRTILAVGKLANEEHTLELLHRYEISYSRMYDRALKALQNLQQNHHPEPEKPKLRNHPKAAQIEPETWMPEENIVQTSVPTAPEEPEILSS